MSEAAGFTRGRTEIVHFLPSCPDDALHDHLRDALARLNHDRCLSQIDCDDLNLAAIVRVYRSGTVQQSQSLVQGQAAARSDLRFETDWQGNGYAGGNER